MVPVSLAELLPLHLVKEFEEVRVLLDLDISVDTNHEDPVGPRQSGGREYQVQGPSIRPIHVVEDEEQGTFLGDVHCKLRDPVYEPQSVLVDGAAAG